MLNIYFQAIKNQKQLQFSPKNICSSLDILFSDFGNYSAIYSRRTKHISAAFSAI